MGEELEAIKKKIIGFRNNRAWKKFHNPKSLSQAIGVEAAELQKIFLWKTSTECKKFTSKEIEVINDKVADIFIYLIYFCHEFNIDLFKTAERKIEINAKKHTVNEAPSE